MLDLINVRKTFNPRTVNERVALDHINLHLNDGDFVTIIGGNGAGKSTILNAIAGVWPVDEGSIIIELKAGYLGTLSEGEHTITIRSGSGDATISFHVGAQIASPSTGTACVWAWIILGIIALGAGAMAVVLMTHKRNAT